MRPKNRRLGWRTVSFEFFASGQTQHYLLRFITARAQTLLWVDLTSLVVCTRVPIESLLLHLQASRSRSTRRNRTQRPNGRRTQTASRQRIGRRTFGARRRNVKGTCRFVLRILDSHCFQLLGFLDLLIFICHLLLERFTSLSLELVDCVPSGPKVLLSSSFLLPLVILVAVAVAWTTTMPTRCRLTIAAGC